MFELIDITAWVLANLTQILGTLVMILLPLSYLYWRNSIKRAISKKLQVKITRNPASAKRVDWHKHSPLLRFLDIDNEVATTDYPHLQMVSLGEYMASLDANGTISLQKGLISIMERYGPRVALPLALFAPPSWKAESNVVGAFSQSPYAALLISNMLSTLGLISVSTVAQRQNIDAKKYAERAAGKVVAAEVVSAAQDAAATAEAKEMPSSNKKPVQEKKRKYKALELMVHGSNPNTDNGLSSRISNSFHLVDDFPAATGSTIKELLINSNQTPLSAPEPVPIHPLFPDLANGNGGCKMSCSEGQAQVNQVFAIVCNKLAANSLVGLGASSHEPKNPFIVRVPSSSSTSTGKVESVDSVEDLVDALEKCGHTVTVSIFANTTSFGIGLCVKEGEGEQEGRFDTDGAAPTTSTTAASTKWSQIPLAYPLSTGLYAQDENGDEMDVVTLMQHAAVTLKIQGPLLSAQVDWCLSISGMTGWGPNQEIDRVWARDYAARTWHAEKELSTSAGRRSALKLTTASSSVLNVAASEENILFGGYGSLGVCIDSVAAIQQCISGTCTLYPLILGGDAKMGLLSCYKHIRELGRKKENSSEKWKYDAEAEALVNALLQLPCDGIVDPSIAAATAQRALNCLPERSVFAGMKECKASLKAAIKSAEAVMSMQNT